MIDPKLLTPENGFVEGVVVEINGNPYTFDYFGKYADGFIDAIWLKNNGPVFDPRKINSIRPLTGPMAIWNFAPEWAEWCINWGESIEWGSDGAPVGSGTPVYRPSWAKEAK